MPVDIMLEAMRIVYATAGIRVELASRETLNLVADPILATLTDLDVGNCGGNVTHEQDLLFLHRNNVGDDDIVVYFINTTVPFLGDALLTQIRSRGQSLPVRLKNGWLLMRWVMCLALTIFQVKVVMIVIRPIPPD
jgi:hypothetical protein